MTLQKKSLLLINVIVAAVIVMFFVFSIHFFTNIVEQVNHLNYLKSGYNY